ncbi:hypothetical protein FPRO04_12305 [Fusarium proliferatum]|nr:hypothetical protein FPRO04_12305 [Fusarium proliferatum]
MDQIKRAIDTVKPMLKRKNMAEEIWQGNKTAQIVSLQLQLEESIAKECEVWLAAGRDILVFINGRMKEQVAQHMAAVEKSRKDTARLGTLGA